MPQPALVEKAKKCCSTGAMVRGVHSARRQTDGGTVSAPLSCLVMLPCSHETSQGALDGFPTTLRESTSCLGPWWML